MAAPIDPATIASVLAEFPLEHPQIERSIEASTMNENLVVSDATGQRFVLRHHRRNPEFERIAFQLRFQDFLLRNGYPVPEILPTRDGELLVSRPVGAFALFGFVDGETYDFDRLVQATEAGRRLAQFHALTEQFSEPEAKYALCLPIREWWTAPDEILDGVAALFDTPIEEEVDYLREWAAQLHAEVPLEVFDSLPAGWCHLDYHGRNLIFVEDEVRAMLDFDKMQRGPYVLDIERGIHAFGRRGRGSNELRPDAVAAFIGGYEEVRPLSAAERAATLAMMGWMALPFPSMVELFKREGDDALADFRRDIEGLRVRRALAAELAGRI